MQTATQKKFGHLFTGEWTHPHSMGVGIELSGVPTSIDDFIEVLKDFSCNEIAARRVLNDLLTDGERKVTVMYHLNFLFLDKCLKEIGVNMKIIPPSNHSSEKYFEYSAIWDGEIENIIAGKMTLEDALLPKLPIERKIFKERYDVALLSDAILQVVGGNK